MKRRRYGSFTLPILVIIMLYMALHVPADQSTVTLSPDRLALRVNETKQVVLLVGGKQESVPNAGASEWKSSNPAVAAVSSKGVVKALSPGKAVISCKTAYSSTVSCMVTVTASSGTNAGAGNSGTGGNGAGNGTASGTGGVTGSGANGIPDVNSVTVKKVKKIRTIGQAKKTYRLETYLNKPCTRIVSLSKYASRIDKRDDLAGIGNLYEFGDVSNSSMSLRYNRKNKKITYLLNTRITNLSLYGIKIRTTEARAGRLLAGKGWKYVTQEFSSPGYWLVYKKGKAGIRLLIVSGRVKSYQWSRKL